ncbi:MAG: UDP binding domain-containing protein [Acidimicrobiales bacterium]
MEGPIVGFVGQTHLGIVSAAVAAARGCRVVAYDADVSLVASLAERRLPLYEPGLDDLVTEHAASIRYTTDLAALARCDLVYVSVDVPTDDAGVSDLGPINAALAAATAATAAPVVVLSQVPPGFTRRAAAGDLRVLYQGETLVFGEAVARAMTPQRFSVGTADGSGLPPPLAGFLARFGCPVLSVRLESAELCKLAINVLLAASVTATNTLAGVCEGVGADWQEIVPALRLDPRIGAHAYLSSGVGLTGGNIERDLATVTGLADAVGTARGLIDAISADSSHRRGWVLRRLAPVLEPGSAIAVLGLAYKPDTRSIKKSLGIELAELLSSHDLRTHDPLVVAPVGRSAADPFDAATGADAVAIVTAWDDYRSLDPAVLARTMRGRLVVDPHGVLDSRACRAAGLDHHVLGTARP